MEQILQNMRSGRNELENFLDNELKSFCGATNEICLRADVR